MPHRRWFHNCRCDLRPAWLTKVACPTCGTIGTYAGFRYGMYEAMGAYQRTYGLTPVGPHRRFADHLLSSLTRDCEGCDGTGLREIDWGKDWRKCFNCYGTGQVLTCKKSVFAAALREVIALYPEAQVGESVLLVGGLSSESGRMR